MPFCPQCRFEYVAGVTTCPDCGVPLVDDLSAAPRGGAAGTAGTAGGDPAMRIIFGGDLLSCDQLVRELHAAGIAAAVHREMVETPEGPRPSLTVAVREETWERREETIRRCVARVTGEGAPVEDIPDE